jgi:hypothetical protein
VLAGALVLIVVGIALGIFFPLLFIITGIGLAVLIVALVNGARERRAAASPNRVD